MHNLPTTLIEETVLNIVFLCQVLMCCIYINHSIILCVVKQKCYILINYPIYGIHFPFSHFIVSKPILCLPIIKEKVHYCVTYWLNRYFITSNMIFMCLKNAPVSNFISPFCTLSVHPIIISVFRFGLSCPIIDCHHNLTIIESIICKCFKYIY